MLILQNYTGFYYFFGTKLLIQKNKNKSEILHSIL